MAPRPTPRIVVETRRWRVSSRWNASPSEKDDPVGRLYDSYRVRLYDVAFPPRAFVRRDVACYVLQSAAPPRMRLSLPGLGINARFSGTGRRVTGLGVIPAQGRLRETLSQTECGRRMELRRRGGSTFMNSAVIRIPCNEPLCREALFTGETRHRRVATWKSTHGVTDCAVRGLRSLRCFTSRRCGPPR